MIEVYKIEDFVIEQLFMPYAPFLIPYEIRGKDKTKRTQLKIKLEKNPENIIEVMEGAPEIKQFVFNRLKKCGGIKWYRYLDMSNSVIQWVNENLEKSNE